MVTVTGSDSATVTEVILVESSGAGKINGSVKAQGSGDFLAQFDRIPTEAFVVLVKGQIRTGSSRAASVMFQRQSSTSIRASYVTVTSVSKCIYLKTYDMTFNFGCTAKVFQTNH